MLSNSLRRLNRTNRLITVDDISDNLLAGRSAAHTQCWKYLQQASYDAALDQSEAICLREPERPDGFVFKARALFKLKRYEEAEEVLLHVMKIAEQNDLIRTDVEGMVKLKDELANSRVEILREQSFRNPMDIAEMHWNDYHKPILELIGFASRMRGAGGSRGVGGGDGRRSAAAADIGDRPMDVDLEIVDIIGAERAKALYPDLVINSPRHKSTPVNKNGGGGGVGGTGYTARRRAAGGHSNLDISGEFPTPSRNTSKEESIVKDVELRTAGLKTQLMLAEEKALKSDQKNRKLEDELKRVYQHLLKATEENKNLQRKCDTLEEQLDKVTASKAASQQQQQPNRSYTTDDIEVIGAYEANRFSGKSPKQRAFVFTNSNRKRQNFEARNRSAAGGMMGGVGQLYDQFDYSGPMEPFNNYY